MNYNKDLLLKDNDYFYKELTSLLPEHKGEYALIHDERIDKLFKTKDDAISYALKKYKLGTFLVKEIEEHNGAPKYISFRCTF